MKSIAIFFLSAMFCVSAQNVNTRSLHKTVSGLAKELYLKKCTDVAPGKYITCGGQKYVLEKATKETKVSSLTSNEEVYTPYEKMPVKERLKEHADQYITKKYDAYTVQAPLPQEFKIKIPLGSNDSKEEAMRKIYEIERIGPRHDFAN